MTPAGPAASRRRRIGREDAELVRVVADRLPVRIEAMVPLDLETWARDNLPSVDRWLDEQGAVVLSGFASGGAGEPLDTEVFGSVSRILLGTDPCAYRERSSPRTQLAPGVYTSTEQPRDQPIVLHNENAYQQSLPTRLAFGCVVPALSGGATPLADCVRILGRLDPSVVDRFRTGGVRYVRVFGHGVGLSWQETFGTDARGEVDRYCAKNGIVASWDGAGRLRTEQTRPAVVRHPRTGDEAWLNHVLLFGPHGTAPSVRAALLDRFAPDDLPLQVRYGDGAPIEDDVHRAVRDAVAAESVATVWQPGDVMVIDNLRIAHGREPYEGRRTVLVGMAGSFTAEWAT